MITSCLLQNHFTATLTTLLITLLISACSTEEDLSTATAPDTNTNTSANHAAIITGIDSGSVTEDVDPDGNNLLETSGTLTITDINPGEAEFIAGTVTGTNGSLTIYAAGNWSYAAGNNQVVIQNLATGAILTDNLVVSSIDGTTHTVVITIKGADETNTSPPSTNIPATITGTDKGNVTEDVDPDGNNLLETGGKLTITDNNPGETAFTTGTVTGTNGSLTIDAAGNWSYAANNRLAVIQNLTTGATLTDSLVVSSIDGTTHTVVMTINGVDEPPSPAVIAGTDTGSITEDIDPDGDNLLETGGKLTITDINPGEAEFIAGTVTSNYGSLTIDIAGNWSYAVNNSQTAIQSLATGATLINSLVVSSVDGTSHTVVMTINGVDEPNTIILSWVAPAEREDNSALSLSDIAGYKIYYGTTQSQYSDNVTINDSTATGYTFTSLPAGTYYIVVTTIDTEGRESQYSPEVVITI